MKLEVELEVRSKTFGQIRLSEEPGQDMYAKIIHEIGKNVRI